MTISKLFMLVSLSIGFSSPVFAAQTFTENGHGCKGCEVCDQNGCFCSFHTCQTLQDRIGAGLTVNSSNSGAKPVTTTTKTTK